jgi:hypothetical protein
MNRYLRHPSQKVSSKISRQSLSFELLELELEELEDEDEDEDLSDLFELDELSEQLPPSAETLLFLFFFLSFFFFLS